MLPEGFIFIQRDWLSSNSLLIKNDDAAFLIDSGYFSHADMSLKVVCHYLSEQPLDSILNTHLHSDHCGGNATFQNYFPSVSIYVPAAQFEAVNSWDTSILSFDMTGQNCNRFTATSKLVSGNSFEMPGYSWQIIGSPGHDSDSVMFYEPEFRILVSADALWQSGVSVVFPEFSGESGFEDALLTLEMIEKLNPLIVMPGHGTLFTDVSSAIDSARVKLNQFIADPRYHALYSAKVLLKFKLMELGKIELQTFLSWCLKSTLLKKIHSHYFIQYKFNEWLINLLQELKRKKAIAHKDDLLFNLN